MTSVQPAYRPILQNFSTCSPSKRVDGLAKKTHNIMSGFSGLEGNSSCSRRLIQFDVEVLNKCSAEAYDWDGFERCELNY